MSDETAERPKRRSRTASTGANMRAAANGEPQWSGRTGRPSKYRPEFDAQAKRLCLLGFTNEQLASVFNVNLATLNDWAENLESFSRALVEGRDGADGMVAASLFHRAIGYRHDAEQVVTLTNAGQFAGSRAEKVRTFKQYPPDTAAAFIWLKNRRRDLWRDDPLGLAHLPPEQQARVVQDAIRAANSVTMLPAPETPNDDSGEETPNT